VRENLYGDFRSPRQATSSTEDPQQRLIFVAPHQATYQSLRSATQERFPNARVTQVDRLPEGADETVDLVLLGAVQQVIAPGLIATFRQHFPFAALAVVIDNGSPMVDPAVIEQRLIRGLLPTTLPLDVWLAVVQLVLAGGEFLTPTTSDRAFAPIPPKAPPLLDTATISLEEQSQPTERPSARAGDAGERGLDTLTVREREILTLVSEGYQNKLIADRMALSEHTVKAHVHNLIAKLRVTNRTQAAAYMHEHRFDRAGLLEPGSDRRRRPAIVGS
jgi:DNA-binding NarL/FixJ family response regulator